MNKKYEFHDLVNIMEKLRGGNGCPWDREQTKLTLKKYVLEEAYEVVDAIDEGSYGEICEELGDLLLQVVFLSQVASEEEEFTINDVITSICTKMINRHPHVFGGEKLETADQVNKSWQEIKNKEKYVESYANSMRGIPKGMSALLRSYKIQDRAANVGFDWDNALQAFEKVFEEIEEVKELIDTNQNEELTKEIGDLIFAVVNVSRLLKIDPETALMTTNKKFINRFEHIEQNSIKCGKKLELLTLKEMDKLWEESKKIYK